MKKPLIIFIALVAMLLGSVGQTYAQPGPRPAPRSGGGGSNFGAGIAGGILGLTTALVFNEIAKGAKKKTPARPVNNEQRELMRDIQTRLNMLGYNAGYPDGVSGPRTRAATRAFQGDNNLPPTGKLSPDGMALLYQISSVSVEGDEMDIYENDVGSPTAILQSDELLLDDNVVALALPASMAYDDEIAKTVYETQDAQPTVLGFTLGSNAQTFTKALETNGFENCVGTRQALQCERSTETLLDTIKVWSTDADGVWAVTRSIQFVEPIQSSFVENQFSKSYPKLMQQPQKTTSSAAGCDIGNYDMSTLVMLFDQRDPSDDVEITPSLANLAVTCPIAYGLDFEEANDAISVARTVFFDGTSVVRQQIRALDDTETQVSADLKF